MRRLVTVCSLAMLAVCVSPVPAHAYFWEWLDSLSGPKFAGASVEVKVWCQTDRRAEVIERVRSRLVTRSGPYRTVLVSTLPIPSSARLEFARRGVMAADTAESLLKQAEAAANDKTDAPRYDPSELFFEALRWRDYAYTQFAWADRAEEAARTKGFDFSEDIQRAALLQGLPTPRVLEKTQPRLAGFGGLSFSICPAEAVDRHTRSLNVTVGYGWDQKEANQADNNRMLTIGASYNFVVAPWLTLGFGAGAARFTSDTAETFSKGFVQPWIIDVRPFAMGQRKYSPEAWRQVWFVRVSSITFPGGFDAGQFTGSPRLRTELVHSIGIHADLDPVIRKAQLRW
jgi:hypothetical protein